jgi:hypothetical protein
VQVSVSHEERVDPIDFVGVGLVAVILDNGVDSLNVAWKLFGQDEPQKYVDD